MKNVLLSRIIPAVVSAALVLPVGFGPAAAQGTCWDNGQIQSALAGGQIRSVAEVLAREGIPPSTQVLNVRVCEQSGGPVYILSVLEASGEARNLTVGAQ